MARYLQLPERCITIAITEITEELRTEKDVGNIVQKDAGYQIIPGYLESYVYHIDQIIIKFLPFSKNKLLDICLPYIYSQQKKIKKIEARYILFDNKLLAIKVCITPTWPPSKLQKHSPSFLLQKYYRSNNITFTSNEILIGNFYLQFNNCRIALLFQSEIISNYPYLQSYDNYRCDVMSVMANIPKDIRKEDKKLKMNGGQMELIGRLKRIAREKMVVVVYAGVRIVPNIGNLYFDRSSIMFGGTVTTSNRFIIGENKRTVFGCDLGQTLGKKITNKYVELGVNSKETTIEPFYINNFIKYSKAQQSTRQQKHQKKSLTDSPSLEEITILHLWYIYSIIHNYKPFVLPYPLTIRNRSLFNLLVKLSQYTLEHIDKLVKVYHSVTLGEAKGDRSDRMVVIIYATFKEMVEQVQNRGVFNKYVYVYTDDSQEIKKLKNISEYKDKILNCDGLNPVQLSHKSQQPLHKQPNKSPQFTPIQLKKIEQACTFLLKERMQTMQEMLHYFIDMNLCKTEIQYAFVDVLPRKIKLYVKPMPIYLFLLHESKDKIIYEIGEAELRLNVEVKVKSGGGNGGKMNVNREEQQVVVQNTQRFSKKLQNVKNYKSKLLISYVRCHRCDYHFKKEMVKSCYKCKESLCLECIDIVTKHFFITLDNYKCLLCYGRCNCNKCTKDQIFPPNNIECSQQKVKETVVVQDVYYNEKSFSCSYCEIMGDKCHFIKIQCNQCKKQQCYNCASRQNKITVQQLRIWVCNKCQEFNNKSRSKEQMQKEKVDVEEKEGFLGRQLDRDGERGLKRVQLQDKYRFVVRQQLVNNNIHQNKSLGSGSPSSRSRSKSSASSKNNKRSRSRRKIKRKHVNVHNNKPISRSKSKSRSKSPQKKYQNNQGVSQERPVLKAYEVGKQKTKPLWLGNKNNNTFQHKKTFTPKDFKPKPQNFQNKSKPQPMKNQLKPASNLTFNIDHPINEEEHSY